MMNTSLLFKNAILRLYKMKTYTVDFAIIQAKKFADNNSINAKDYEELLNYLAEEQHKEMLIENVAENTKPLEENI